MSHLRHVVPGTAYLITRRVLRRHFLLRPDAAVTQVLLYTLAVSARRYGVQVHALCAMSTHPHLVVTDVEGILPRFLQFFRRIVALSIKVLRTRRTTRPGLTLATPPGLAPRARPQAPGLGRPLPQARPAPAQAAARMAKEMPGEF